MLATPAMPPPIVWPTGGPPGTPCWGRGLVRICPMMLVAALGPAEMGVLGCCCRTACGVTGKG